MKRAFILFFLISLICSKAFGFEIILPTEKKSIVNTKYIFFVGSVKPGESLSINGNPIYTASNGAFAHTTKLKEGLNNIVLRSNYGMKIYNVYKNTVQPAIEVPVREFETKKAVVNCDNAPLRSTPVDAGLNRMGHLFAGTELLINGKKDDFYRVFLSDNKEGWIAIKDVTVSDCENSTPAEFISMDSKQFKNAYIQNISFTKSLPYVIEDNEHEILFKIYNPELSPNSIYTLNIPKPKKYKYSLSLSNGTYSFKVKELSKTREDVTIAIDAGHGGLEKGAIGCLGDEEKDINLKIAFELQKILEKKGFNTVMTRECDANVSLQDRVNIASEADADLFVSIHLNSIGDIPMDILKNRGTSTFYFNENSKKFAETVQQNIVRHAHTHNDKVKSASFAVIRPTNYIGILVEAAYMTNPLDSVQYRKNRFVKKVAEGIASGIIEYVKE